MEAVNGVLIYWFVSIGLMLGFITPLYLGKEGISLVGNLVAGIIGAKEKIRLS